jgi:hypothetical protein
MASLNWPLFGRRGFRFHFSTAHFQIRLQQSKMKTAPSLAFALVVLATLSSDCSGSRQFVSRIPNGGSVPDVPAIGHSDNTGSSRALNDFGKDFESAGNAWTVSLCEQDSDGDGQTNGQELGDPCCEWTTGATPRRTSSISHPSDSSKTSNESLWANVNCSSVTQTASSATTPSMATVVVLSSALAGILALA